MAKKDPPKPGEGAEQRGAAIDAGVKARNDAISSRGPDGWVGAADRGRAIEAATANRDMAIDAGVAERNARLNREPPGAAPEKQEEAPKSSPSAQSSSSRSSSDKSSSQSTENGGSLHVPAFIAALAKKVMQLEKKLSSIQGVAPVKVVDSAGNVLIQVDQDQSVASNSELHYNNGTISIDIDGGGIVTDQLGGGNHIVINPITVEGFSVQNLSTSHGASVTSAGLSVFGGGGLLSVGASDVVRDIGVRTIDVCDSGTPKSMDIIASDPY